MQIDVELALIDASVGELSSFQSSLPSGFYVEGLGAGYSYNAEVVR
jgi:hypothetical protein